MSMAEYYAHERPPPPAPWMPLFFLAVLASMWALPLWLHFQPLLTLAVKQFGLLVSLLVPVMLVLLLYWSYAPQHNQRLEYPNSRQGSRVSYGSDAGFIDIFGWVVFVMLVLFLLLNTTARTL